MEKIYDIGYSIVKVLIKVVILTLIAIAIIAVAGFGKTIFGLILAIIFSCAYGGVLLLGLIVFIIALIKW